MTPPGFSTNTNRDGGGVKASCGCYVEERPALGGGTVHVVSASAFTCPFVHRQGDAVKLALLGATSAATDAERPSPASKNRPSGVPE